MNLNFCPQSCTHFMAVSEQPVGWDENCLWMQLKLSPCLGDASTDPEGTVQVVGLGVVGVSLTLHFAMADALHVGEQPVTEREALILKYSFANKKP